MFDFDPKRQEQECVEKTTSCKKKTRRDRPEKKPDYCKEKMIGDLIAKAVELFREPYDDRDVRAKDAPKIIEVAEAMNITQIKVRKMLITAEYYSSDLSRPEKPDENHKVRGLLSQGGFNSTIVALL